VNTAADGVRRRIKPATIVPLVVFFLLGMVIDTESAVQPWPVDANRYFALVLARVLLISAAVVFFAPAIRRGFPISVDRWGWIVGMAGAAVWIGICALRLEDAAFEILGVPAGWIPQRESVNPFALYGVARYDGSASGTPWPLVGFLAFRFALLVICVPMAEELFLRGFLMRAVESEDWTALPLARIGRAGVIAGTVYAVASHPGELVAAAAWFSLVTWMMLRTGKFWNCVLAHALTNLLLGLYVCWFEQWHLW